MRDRLAHIIQYFIPDNSDKSAEGQRRAKLTVVIFIIVAYFNINYITISALIDYPSGILSQLPLLVLSIIALIAYKREVNPSLIFPIYFITCSISITISIMNSGGFLSVVFPWLTSTPIVALMVWSKRGSLLSLGFVLLIQIIVFYLYFNDFPFNNEIKPSVAKWFYFTCELGFLLILYWIAIVFENAKNSALNILELKNQEIELEQKKSERLLLNILPEEVAKELKDKGHAEAKLFNSSTVLFIDFVGFSNIAESMTPKELVDEIDYCFRNFDRIIEKFEIEKIKTVGDAYIIASGLPKTNPDHAEIIAEAALEMHIFMMQYQDERKKEKREYFDYRMGISSGSVVAGIVGSNKFAYDIWGDTVNTAARMEQYSETNRINISKTTYDLINTCPKFQFEYRGKIEAKNKGLLDMYFLSG